MSLEWEEEVGDQESCDGATVNVGCCSEWRDEDYPGRMHGASRWIEWIWGEGGRKRSEPWAGGLGSFTDGDTIQ